MKRLLLALFLLVPLAQLAWAGMPIYYTLVSATNVNTTVTIDLDNTNDKAYSLTLCNDGSKAAFFTLDSGVATASDAKLLAGECLTVRNMGVYSVHTLGIITSGADTTTVRVFGWPHN